MIVISDIHGCYKTLLALINKLPKDVKICICGDLIDRGPASLEVIDYIIKNNIDCVRGNHEQMMLTPSSEELWLMNGGDTTLYQYKDNDELLQIHRDWIGELPYFIEYKDVKTADGRYLIISHSAITDTNLNRISKNQEILWNRKSEPINNPDWFNIFGHSPVKSPIIKEWFANIDTGCVYNSEPGYGKLTAIQFPEMIIYEQENID